MQDLEELKARREQLKQMKAIREANKNLQNVKIANETVRLPNLTNAPQAPTQVAGSGYANQLYNQPNIPQTVSDIKLNTGAGDAVISTNEVKNILAKNEEYPHTVRGELRTILQKPEIMKDNLRRFNDGYQFGDVTKTALETVGDTVAVAGGTVADIGLNAVKGLASVPENMAKAGASLVAGGADLIGQDDFANKLRKQIATKNIYTDPIQKGINVVDKASIAGNFTDTVAQGIGQHGAYIATGAALGPAGNVSLGKLNVPLTAVLSGMGSSASEAYSKQGAIDNATWKEKTQNLLKIVGGGVIEGVSEGLFGLFGVGGNELTDVIADKVVQSANSALGKVIAKMTVSGLGEAAEELVSYAGNWVLDNGIINNIGKVDYKNKWDGKEIATEMLSAFLTSAITQGGTSSIQLSNLSKSEIANQEKIKGRALTNEEIKTTMNRLANDILTESENVSKEEIKQVEQINQGANELTSIVKQSLGDREITQSNQQVEVPTHIKTFVENRNKTTPGLSVEMDNTISTEWSKYLKENWDLMPNSTKTMAKEVDTLNLVEKPSKVKKLEDIADLTENDIKTKEMKYKQRADKNTANQRKFLENVETSKFIAQETKDRVNATTYEQKANIDTLEKVRARLDERGNEMIDEWKTKSKNFTDQDVALGAILIERYQQNGDWGSAARTAEKLADMGPEVGRAVQMYSIFQRLSPETMAIYQQKELTKAFEDLKKKKTGKWVEQNKDKFKLTAEDTQFIYDQVEKAQQATDEETKQRELSKIEARINNKLPPEAGQTLKAWRRIAMLLNPKTQVRNIGGNTTIMPVNAVADAIGTQIDKAIAKKTGIRTTNYTNLKNIIQGFGKGAKDAITDYKTGTRTTESGSRYEFEVGTKPFNENTKSKTLNAVNNKLNGVNNLLSAVMSGGDRPFYEAAYKNSLEGQMKANNVTESTQEMIDVAVNEALARTWNDNNNYTQAVLGIRRAMNKINIKGFGLGDLVIPFAKTPANLTKAMVEYSPAGFIDTVIKGNDLRKAISRGEMTAQQQKDFVNSMSKAITGTILYVIAASLVKAGKITGSKDKDKDVANFEQNVLGIQPYSVKIGDKTYTYNWATPINAPLAIMADTYKMSKDDASLWNVLTNAFKVAGDTLVENSFLQGIKELFDADSITEGLVQAFENFPSSLIPTFISQFASLADNTKRQIFEYKNEGKSTLNSIAYKLPGARNKLAPQVNTFGEEISNQNNWFNAFLNPANVREAETTDAQKELYSLYEETKDATIFPRQAPYNVGDTNLTSQNKADYQKKSGQYVSEKLDALFDSDFYKQLDDNAKKAELVNKVISDADILAKSDYQITTTTENLLKKIDSVKQSGLDMSDYYRAWSAQDGVKGYKDSKGNTIDLSESRNKKKAIDEATKDLSELERMKLYRIFDISQKVW